ncbi:protein of unknown function [Shewanella benthica]|uniref:Uncharacterized protein n=1 Tax=Shewanella benthica TaxID=43661 RepID=A0A330M0R3_9GAMM|nr:protein of unknown function [Shewanella benthica]
MSTQISCFVLLKSWCLVAPPLDARSLAFHLLAKAFTLTRDNYYTLPITSVKGF